VPDVLLKGHQSSATSQFLKENILTQLLFNVMYANLHGLAFVIPADQKFRLN